MSGFCAGLRHGENESEGLAAFATLAPAEEYKKKCIGVARYTQIEGEWASGLVIHCWKILRGKKGRVLSLSVGDIYINFSFFFLHQSQRGWLSFTYKLRVPPATVSRFFLVLYTRIIYSTVFVVDYFSGTCLFTRYFMTFGNFKLQLCACGILSFIFSLSLYFMILV